jgi:hypothetical protein
LESYFQSQIQENFINLYQKYHIRSEKLFKLLLIYHGKRGQAHHSIENTLSEFTQKDSALLNHLCPFVPIDQHKNHHAIFSALNLIRLFENIKPFALDAAFTGEFDLFRTYGIDPQPIYNLHSEAEVKAQLARFFPEDIQAFNFIDFFETVQNDFVLIKENLLLGKNTIATFAYLKFWANIKPSELGAITYDKAHIWQVMQINQVIQKTISIMGRHELANGAKKEQAGEMMQKMIKHHLKCSLYLMYIKYPQFNHNSALFYRIFADEIMGLITKITRKYASLNTILIPEGLFRRDDIELAYTSHDEEYIFSGDHYGECTASQVRKQVDPNIANIHWTVYSWILNPYYRIIDLYYQGEKLLKGHILPLIIHRRRILMLDAIEVAPKLRERVRGKDNPYFDKRFTDIRQALLQKLFEQCKDLAQKMGVDSVYVEMFSNAEWVNQEIDKLPHDSYHVDSAIIPFGIKVIARNIEKLQGYLPDDIVIEVQAKNLSLMDQQMKGKYKEVGVLTNRREDWFINTKGI